MSKATKDCELVKHFIRFPEEPNPVRVSIKQVPTLKDSKATSYSCCECETTEVQSEPKVDLSAPVLNSTLCVKKRMNKVEQKKPLKIKGITDLPHRDRVTFDEKITKHMNFPFDKKLYKELISLNLVNKPYPQQQTSTLHEHILKDRVPKLEDFFQPPKNLEYSIPVTSNLTVPATLKEYDGTRLDKVMRTWTNSRPG